MRKPFGLIRLPALPASDVREARTSLTLYAVEPRSTATVRIDAAGLMPGDVAGLALFNGSCSWLGVERAGGGLALARFDERSGRTSRVPLGSRRVWLRADCDFATKEAAFRYSTDGTSYAAIGEPHAMSDVPSAVRGVECSLFSCATKVRGEGGHADFDSFVLATERAGRKPPVRPGPGRSNRARRAQGR